MKLSIVFIPVQISSFMASPFLNYYQPQYFLRKNIKKIKNSNTDISNSYWKNISDMKYIIMQKYFGKKPSNDEKCEIFCIEEVPVASFTYFNTNEYNNPCVDEFYINKAMLVMFDAGDSMRSKLFRRYPYIDTSSAKNIEEFEFW